MKPANPLPGEGQVMKTEGTGNVPIQSKKAYSSPRLIELGELLDVTMGPSPGIGESGNPATFRAAFSRGK